MRSYIVLAMSCSASSKVRVGGGGRSRSGGKVGRARRGPGGEDEAGSSGLEGAGGDEGESGSSGLEGTSGSASGCGAVGGVVEALLSEFVRSSLGTSTFVGSSSSAVR
jgi:hypothetical protein